MTTQELANRLINSNTNDLQNMPNDDLKELRDFLNTKSNEISWILKGRAKAKANFSK